MINRVFDETGDRLTPSHTNRHGRRFRYYISRRLITQGADPTGWRLPAPQLEGLVATAVRDHLCQRAERHDLLTYPDATSSARLTFDIMRLAEGRSDALWPLIRAVHLTSGAIEVQLCAPGLAKALALDPADLNPDLTQIKRPFDLRRRGAETRIISGTPEPQPDPVLQRNLGRAHLWAKAIRKGQSIAALARSEGCSEGHIRSRLALAFLAPSLQRAILAGRLPAPWTTDHLLNQSLPSDWAAQARLLGP